MLGVEMKSSLELMILELGISFQPLQESYTIHEGRVTNFWLKAVWEKCDKFGIRLEFNNVPLKFSRQGDKWLMREFAKAGYQGEDMKALNRVRLYMQVIFSL